MKQIILALVFCFPILVSAQITPKATWSFTAEKKANQKYELKFKATIASGWYIYSSNLESDLGPIPTSLEMDTPDGIKIVGTIKEDGNKIAGYDEIFQMNVVKYKGEVTFIQEIEVPAGTKVIEGNVTYMTCNDNQCLPPAPTPFKIQL